VENSKTAAKMKTKTETETGDRVDALQLMIADYICLGIYNAHVDAIRSPDRPATLRS